MPTAAQLRRELGKRKLPTDGRKDELEKRLRGADREVQKKAKLMKTTVDLIVDEYLCPITQELPIDPVTAEDGRVYERSAIEEWLATNEKSPHTNEPMGKREG